MPPTTKTRQKSKGHQNPKSRDNLGYRTAPDNPSQEGPLVMFSGAVPAHIKEAIRNLPGSHSQGEHLRRALKNYLDGSISKSWEKLSEDGLVNVVVDKRPTELSFNSAVHKPSDIEPIFWQNFPGYDIDFFRATESKEKENTTICPVVQMEPGLSVELSRAKREIEFHINRCSFGRDVSVSFIGDRDRQSLIDSGRNPDGCPLEILFDKRPTKDLNVEQTLARLRLVDSECTYYEFLNCIVDNAEPE